MKFGRQRERLFAPGDLLLELRIANIFQQFAIGRSRRDSDLLQVVAGDQRWRIELGGRQGQLGSAVVDLRSAAVERLCYCLTEAKQLVNPRGNEQALQFGPRLLAGGAD